MKWKAFVCEGYKEFTTSPCVTFVPTFPKCVLGWVSVIVGFGFFIGPTVWSGTDTFQPFFCCVRSSVIYCHICIILTCMCSMNFCTIQDSLYKTCSDQLYFWLHCRWRWSRDVWNVLNQDGSSLFPKGSPTCCWMKTRCRPWIKLWLPVSHSSWTASITELFQLVVNSLATFFCSLWGWSWLFVKCLKEAFK